MADDHGLSAMLVSLLAAHRDLNVPPRFEAPPIPVSFTIVPEGELPRGRWQIRSTFGVCDPSFPRREWSCGRGS
ncbi:hypothetical protein GCM10017771_50460 [Streptomyces capitiformicae]|uniref:Uncharacterized protein n=1 Tax=Streptomyces capitiformicae TaxID=2014920 RepID=A0A919DDL8_9ACTN|nr:hypothetical protein GCM10017771_50460 [Streptomyces capitiformicae]